MGAIKVTGWWVRYSGVRSKRRAGFCTLEIRIDLTCNAILTRYVKHNGR